ncbi:InlB B-repeat-containing protein, partial [Bifidobacterium sp. LC6]|nr:InlB B-repeat-containing protein [Bifidobacterium colobi]
MALLATVAMALPIGGIATTAVANENTSGKVSTAADTNPNGITFTIKGFSWDDNTPTTRTVSVKDGATYTLLGNEQPYLDYKTVTGGYNWDIQYPESSNNFSYSQWTFSDTNKQGPSATVTFKKPSYYNSKEEQQTACLQWTKNGVPVTDSTTVVDTKSTWSMTAQDGCDVSLLKLGLKNFYDGWLNDNYDSVSSSDSSAKYYFYYVGGTESHAAVAHMLTVGTPVNGSSTPDPDPDPSQYHTVTIRNELDNITIAQYQVLDGYTASKPSDPLSKQPGYTFAGWYTAAEGGTEYDFNTPVTSDITIYAHWTKDTSQRYTVKFDLNGAPGSVDSQSVESSKTAYRPSDPSRDGYTFGGWYTAATGGSRYDFSTAVTKDITIYAHWYKDGAPDPDLNYHTVTFRNELDDMTIAQQTILDGYTATKPSDPASLQQGYKFAGWYTAAEGGTEYDFNTPVTKDITIYAHWTETDTPDPDPDTNPDLKYHTVTIRNELDNQTIAQQTILDGYTATKPSDPQSLQDGYTFVGWYTAAEGGTEYDFDTPVTSDITIYAHWKKGNDPTPQKYTVKFNVNGGSGSVASQTVESGKTAASPSNPTRDGYTFDGWYTAKTGGSRYDFSTPVKKNLTLYAHWTKNETPSEQVRVLFDDNYSNDPLAQIVNKGETVSRPADPTRDGYTFDGWFTAASGGSEYDFSTPVTEDVTLYAHWTKDESPAEKIVVIFEDKDGAGQTFAEMVEKGKTVPKPNDPKRAGYSFLGWFTKLDGGEKYSFDTPVTEKLT